MLALFISRLFTLLMAGWEQRARELGTDYGKSAGSWITFDSRADALAWIARDENCEATDTMSGLYSGEFAGGPTSGRDLAYMTDDILTTEIWRISDVAESEFYDSACGIRDDLLTIVDDACYSAYLETVQEHTRAVADPGYDDEVLRAAARDACITLDLPITDAAFDLIDKVVSYVLTTVTYGRTLLTPISREEAIDALRDGQIASECGDWASGSGVITCYTSDQVRLFADLGACFASIDSTYTTPDNSNLRESCEMGAQSVATYGIGITLSAIAYEICSAVCDALARTLET